MSRLKRLIVEIHQRSVWQALVVYLGASYAVLEAVDLFIERLALPDWLFPIAFLLFVVGLPVVVSGSLARREVYGDEVPAEDAEVAAEEDKRLRLLTWRTAGLAFVGALALWGIVATVWLVTESGATRDRVTTRGPSTYSTTSIAVLGFEDFSEDGRLEHVANGLTEYVITALAWIPALDVRARNAVRPFRQSALQLDSIAEVLEVGTFVEGSVSGSLERALVTVQLIDAANLSHRLSRTIEASAVDPLDLVQTVGDTVANLLREHLALEIQTELQRLGTDSEEAWDRFVQGQRSKDDAVEVPTSSDTASIKVYLDLAERRFAEAEAYDRRWIAPIVQRGWVAALRARYLAGPNRKYDLTWIGEGLTHVDRALELEPNNAAALELRGILLEQLSEGETSAVKDSLRAEAEATLRRALQIDGSRAIAWSKLSKILEEQTRYADAKEAAEKAYEADAFQEDWPTILSRLCWTSLQLKQFDEVTRWCKEGRRRYPESAHYAALWLAALAGPKGPEPNVEQTWELAATLHRLMPDDEREVGEPALQMQVAAVLARAGLVDSAKSVLRRGRAQATENDPELDYQEANVRLQLGERDAALQLLESLLKARPYERELIAKDWWFESLRDHPRFQALVARNE